MAIVPAFRSDGVPLFSGATPPRLFNNSLDCGCCALTECRCFNEGHSLVISGELDGYTFGPAIIDYDPDDPWGIADFADCTEGFSGVIAVNVLFDCPDGGGNFDWDSLCCGLTILFVTCTDGFPGAVQSQQGFLLDPPGFTYEDFCEGGTARLGTSLENYIDIHVI